MAEEKIQASFRISYFPGHGRAAPMRMAAALGGLAFEDEFLNGKQIKEKQEKGEMRWKGVPELTLYGKDGKKLCIVGQSNTCLRYIGALANNNSYPRNPLTRALFNEVLDSMKGVS
eukprot:UN10088